jgi:hypothetical protein
MSQAAKLRIERRCRTVQLLRQVNQNYSMMTVEVVVKKMDQT